MEKEKKEKLEANLKDSIQKILDEICFGDNKGMAELKKEELKKMVDEKVAAKLPEEVEPLLRNNLRKAKRIQRISWL